MRKREFHDLEKMKSQQNKQMLGIRNRNSYDFLEHCEQEKLEVKAYKMMKSGSGGKFQKAKYSSNAKDLMQLNLSDLQKFSNDNGFDKFGFKRVNISYFK